jgi:LmbE family N-acetylglucosaminyl deacetylase
MIGADQLISGSLADTRITDGIDTIKVIENAMDAVGPDFVFTHSPKDSHQDHRNAYLASMSAARHTSRILLYESPTALQEFSPRPFIDISRTMNPKLRAEAFNSQAAKPYMNGKTRPTDPCRNCENYSQISNRNNPPRVAF